MLDTKELNRPAPVYLDLHRGQATIEQLWGRSNDILMRSLVEWNQGHSGHVTSTP
jgi:hypothetical protein